MVTTIGKETNAVEMLENLVALDMDAVEAYREAIGRLENADFKQQLESFRNDHERHIRELQPVVRELGGNPPDSADMKSVLTKGKVMIAGLAGDRSVLNAMKSNEDDTNTAYDRAVEREDLPTHVRELLTRNQADEHRHREWLEATLQRL